MGVWRAKEVKKTASSIPATKSATQHPPRLLYPWKFEVLYKCIYLYIITYITNTYIYIVYRCICDNLSIMASTITQPLWRGSYIWNHSLAHFQHTPSNLVCTCIFIWNSSCYWHKLEKGKLCTNSNVVQIKLWHFQCPLPSTCLEGILGNLLAEWVLVDVDLTSLETYC